MVRMSVMKQVTVWGQHPKQRDAMYDTCHLHSFIVITGAW